MLFQNTASLLQLFFSKEDRVFLNAIQSITGQRVYNVDLYKLAVNHSSAAAVNTHGIKESNERLEYLGDAVLGMVVADYLFTQFPFKEEGFLTEIRSKIVNRESLNLLSRKIGLNQLIKYHRNQYAVIPKSIFGDSLEALIGAVYKDKGFSKCRKFIIEKIILAHYDLDELINTTTNHKSKLIEWAQKENKKVSFKALDLDDSIKKKQFTTQVVIDEQVYEIGYGLSKKKAAQDAARRTLEVLDEQIDE